MFIVVKASTKKGQEIMTRASRNEGRALHHVYSSHSVAKDNAFEDCRRRAILDNALSSFHICSHNSNKFSVAWITDEFVHYETADNIYIVILNQ